MKKHLLSTSGLNFIYGSMLAVGIATASVSNAENIENIYSPNVEISHKSGKKRNITESDYMQPVLATDNDLLIVDTKLKADNKNSKEINLGLVHRHNFDDKVILGAYGYYDHRRTSSGFSVGGATFGVEALSNYLDARVNVYKPFKAKRKIKHNNTKTLSIKGTSLFALTGGHLYEYAFKGYDAEIGAPIFGFSDNLNNKLGTKLFVGKYHFEAKGVKSIDGTRFRLEQPLGSLEIGKHGLYFGLSLENQHDKVRGRQNLVGLSAKMDFDNKRQKSKGLKTRMMDTVIRDVDIVTKSHKQNPEMSDFVINNRRVNKIYYVGNAPAPGDGTADSPLSVNQLNGMDLSNAIVVIKEVADHPIDQLTYNALVARPEVINGKQIEMTSTGSADKLTVRIEQSASGEILIVATDKNNTEFEIEGENYKGAGSSDAVNAVAITPVNAPVNAPVYDQVDAPVDNAPIYDQVDAPVDNAPIYDQVDAPVNAPVYDQVNSPVDNAPVYDQVNSPVDNAPVDNAPVDAPVYDQVNSPVDNAPIYDQVDAPVNAPVDNAPFELFEGELLENYGLKILSDEKLEKRKSLIEKKLAGFTEEQKESVYELLESINTVTKELVSAKNYEELGVTSEKVEYIREKFIELSDKLYQEKEIDGEERKLMYSIHVDLENLIEAKHSKEKYIDNDGTGYNTLNNQVLHLQRLKMMIKDLEFISTFVDDNENSEILGEFKNLFERIKSVNTKGNQGLKNYKNTLKIQAKALFDETNVYKSIINKIPEDKSDIAEGIVKEYTDWKRSFFGEDHHDGSNINETFDKFTSAARNIDEKINNFVSELDLQDSERDVIKDISLENFMNQIISLNNDIKIEYDLRPYIYPENPEDVSDSTKATKKVLDKINELEGIFNRSDEKNYEENAIDFIQKATEIKENFSNIEDLDKKIKDSMSHLIEKKIQSVIEYAEIKSKLSDLPSSSSEEDFGGDFGRNYGGDFGEDFGGDFGRNYGEDFGGDFGEDFGEDFGGDFGRDFGGDFGRNYGEDFGRNYGGDFGRNYGGDFGGDLYRNEKAPGLKEFFKELKKEKVTNNNLDESVEGMLEEFGSSASSSEEEIPLINRNLNKQIENLKDVVSDENEKKYRDLIEEMSVDMIGIQSSQNTKASLHELEKVIVRNHKALSEILQLDEKTIIKIGMDIATLVRKKEEEINSKK